MGEGEEEVSDQAVFYALSTLGQTCAALAAFVGAVGLYRLQLLRNRQSEAEFELRRWAEGAATSRDTWRSTLDEILAGLDNPALSNHPNLPRARQARVAWDSFVPRLRRSRRALVVFEGWNLFAILISLVGFAHVHRLVGQWWTPRALWCIAVITVMVTDYCVFVWLKRDD
jgi:hypothetical protein